MHSARVSSGSRPIASPIARLTAYVTAAALFLSPVVTYAGEVAGAPQVVAGAVTFQQNGNIRTITQQSGSAIVNWQDFSVSAGDLTRFLQPGANSAILNRVLGAQPSLVNGQLQANGSVYLINPNGVIVGPQGRIDVGAFFASTLNVSDDEFLQGGPLRFAGDSRAGVQNLGQISASEGDVMLIAYTVRNGGTISAAKGVAGLAAGSEVLLTHQGDQRIAVKSGLSAAGLETGVENTGLVQAAQAELKAAGGSIYALAVNQAGAVRATGVEMKNGRVLLTAAGGNVSVSGEIGAHNADGSGGEILVGGGYQGKDPAVANAANTQVTSTAKLDASAAGTTGNGGRIVVWADQATQFDGSIVARGGSTGGDGGTLEVSGKHLLGFTGTADTSAPAGKRGSLLLDPDALTISTDPTQSVFSQGGFFQPDTPPSNVNNAVINSLLATTDVGISTSGPAGFNGLSVNADLSWNTASTLTLGSGDTIAINANINGGTLGNLSLQPGTVSATDGTTGAITLAATKAITVNTLSIQKSFIGSASSTSIGPIALSGVVTAGTIDLDREFGGVQGDVTINNPANQIGTLRGTGAAGTITGNLRVADSAGGLIVDGNLSGISGAVEIATTGNLTVNSGALVTNTGASDLVLASRGGSFINNAGAAAIDASGAGRYLIYSDTPSNTTTGGLTGATTYNKTYTANAPATITATGDRFLYSLAPTLTFTASNASKVYGDANPVFNYTVTGLLSGDTLAAAISGTPALSTTATTATGAGTAAISVANGSLALSDVGYSLSLQPGTLTISKAPLTITANDAARNYGAANPAFAASYSGLVNGDTASAVTGLSLTTAATATSGIGNYAISAGGAASANYTLSFASGNLTINRAPLTITADNLAKTYGAANPALTASYSGLVNGETASVVSGLALATGATATSGVGNYTITPSSATAANYAISFATGNLAVNKAPLTVTADSLAKTYGAANPALTASYTGFVNGDTAAAVSGLALNTTALTGSGVGSYPVTASGATAANYALTFVPGTLVINPASLTIQASAASRTYGAANPAFTATYSGFVNGDTAAVVSGLSLGTVATASSNAGTYAITGSGASATNYTIGYSPGTLTVDKAPLTITPSSDARTYGAANPAFTASYSGLVNGDTSAAVSGLVLGTTAVPSSSVGTYPVNASGATSANYALTFGSGTLTVNPAPLVITANDASRVFGVANPAFTSLFSGLVNGDNSSVVTGLLLTTTANVNSVAGGYPITASGGSATNYSISYLPGTLTISNALLTITADSFSRTYGSANPAFTATYSGFTGGDTPAIVSGLQFSTSATLNSGVGTYAITPFGATAPNYGINFVPGSLSITPAALTIRASDVARNYGAADPAFTGVFTGLVAGDTAASITGLQFTTGTTATTGIGNYAITTSGATNPNYTITQLPGTLTIDRAPLTITADNQSKSFGAANPALTASYTGLVNGETSSVVSGLTLATTAGTNSPNGTYPITAAGATAANYAITFVPGTLSIGTSLLTITADSFSRTYGAANPGFTASYSGFVGGDNASVVSGLQFSTTATQASGVGTYTITPFGATAPNYSVSFVPGSLSITPAALAIRPDDIARTYGSANPAFTAGYTGFVNGDTASVVSGLTLGTTATSASGAGTYAIAASGATSPNYTISYTPGTLTVNKAPLTITADNLGKLFGAANPALTASYTGLVNGDTAAAVSGLALATTAVTNSPVGVYPITASGATASNYAISFLPGSLTIGNSLLTITADNASRAYGATNPAFIASYSGFAGSDTSAIVSGLQFSTSATQNSGVGTYTITPFGATAPNYAISFVPGSLSITPAALTIRPDDLARSYGAANPSFTASFAGLVNGDTSSVVSGLTLGTTATAGSNVGSYPITASGASAANYAISYGSGSLTVNKAPLTITANDVNKTYGAANPAFTATYSGLVNGDASSVVSGLSLGTTASAASPVGSYPIAASGATAANYSITTANGLLSVQPALLTVTANNATRVYGDANPVFGGTVSGFVNGDTASVLTAQPAYGSPASVTANVGNYTITPSGGAASNYTFNYRAGSLSITPAVLSVRADNVTRVYGDANPVFTYTVSGLKNGDSADGKFFIFTLGSTAAPNSSVGNYNILLTGNDTPNDNYTTFFANGTLTVQPRPLTITTDAVSRQYGLANPAFTATFAGLASFDSASAISNLHFISNATTATGVGTSLVFPAANSNPNYAITFLPGQLTITPAPLSVLAGGDVTRTYGDANPVFTPFITAGTLYNGDTAASIGLTTSTAATPASSAGKYAVTARLTSPNYTLTPFDGSITILPLLLSVGVASVTRVYGDANPAITAAIVGGASALRNGDTAASIGLTGTTTATPASSVGFYPLSAALTSPNYQLNITAGSLQITPASLNVTVGNGTRVYGDANPAVAFSATGLKNSDTAASVLALSTAATPASSVGSYALSAVPATPNYILGNVTTGLLQITPRPVTITFNDGTRIYGGTDPLFSFQIGGRGFAPSDTVAGILGSTPGTTTATTLSNVGAYPITLAPNTNPNYTFTVQPGTLTVTPRSVSIAADSFAISGGDAQPAFTAQATGLPGGVTTVQAFPNLQFTTQPFTSAVTLSSGTTLFPQVSLDPGTTVISSLINVTGYASNPNYTVTQVTPGILTTTTKSAATELTLSSTVPPASTTATGNATTGTSLASEKQAFDTGSSFGLPPEFNGVLRGVVQDALLEAITSKDSSLLQALFGDDWVNYTQPGELTDAAITAALADFHGNSTKEMALMPYFLDYLEGLAAPGADLNATQKQLLAYIAPFVATVRDSVIDQVQAEKAAYDAEQLKANTLGAGTVTQYTPTYPPYNEFMKVATDNVVQAKITAINIGLTVGAGGAGAVAGTLGIGSTAFVRPLAIAIRPFGKAAKKAARARNAANAEETTGETGEATVDVAPVETTATTVETTATTVETTATTVETTATTVETAGGLVTGTTTAEAAGGLVTGTTVVETAGGALGGGLGAAAGGAEGALGATLGAAAGGSAGGGATGGALSSAAAGGAAMVGVLAVAGIAAGTVMAITGAVAEERYNNLIAQKNQPLDLQGYMKNDNAKAWLATALLGMMSNTYTNGVSLHTSP